MNSSMGYVPPDLDLRRQQTKSFGWTIEFHTPVRLIATSLAVVTFAAALAAGMVPSVGWARRSNRCSASRRGVAIISGRSILKLAACAALVGNVLETAGWPAGVSPALPVRRRGRR